MVNKPLGFCINEPSIKRISIFKLCHEFALTEIKKLLFYYKQTLDVHHHVEKTRARDTLHITAGKGHGQLIDTKETQK